MKKIVIIFIACLLSSFLNAAQKETFAITDFTVQGKNIVKSSLSSFPLTIKCSKSDEVTLTGQLILPSGWNNDAGIFLYKNLMSCKVYVNDELIDTIGRPGPDFFFQPYISRGVLVPSSILKKNNTVRLELWNDTGTYKIRQLDVVDSTTYNHNMRIYNFLDVQLPRFACVLLLFVAVYSLFMFVNYKEKKEFLHLALSAFLFAVYLLNVTIYSAEINYLLLKAFLYSCFPASILFIIRFFRRFFIIQTPKKIRYALNCMGIFFIAGYYFQRTTAALDTWHSIMLIYPFIGLGYGIYGFFKSLKEDGPRNISTGIGLLIAILFSGYDMYNFMLDITPFILLQGLGFMALIIGTFYSISQEIADMNRKCIIFAEELEKDKDKQDAMFEHVKGASVKADSTGKILDTSISSVSSLVSQYLTSIAQVNSNIEIQYQQVTANKESVSHIFTTIDKMSEMVEQHEKFVNETVTDVSSLTTGIHKTDSLIRKSSETLKTLTQICTVANTDVADSSRLIDDLASYSKHIYDIANSISELSQQTNVLSINAAIEAARSGEAGKGFSVVSGEIRSLAAQSGDSAKKINEILSTMMDKINNIQNQEKLVSSRLQDVISENTKTETEIEDIFKVLQAQLEQSNHISTIITNLIETVHTIATQTAEQKESGESLNHSLELLSSITDSVLTASKEQNSSIEELKSNLSKIRNASEENVGVISELKQMLESTVSSQAEECACF
jgi:methyl-accepting chemotaxis protein